MNRYIIPSLLCLLLFSCKTEEISPVGEAPKNISGSWKILKATRNGTDITNAFDFTQFRVKFDSTGNYTIVNRVPFLVNVNGTYVLDDPAYPFRITFTPQGGSAVATPFNYITTAGVRQLNLTFVPGCELNVYIYTLEKDN
ncbi:MAG: hypothetical protein H6Q26_2470 [Bacteroidetes bacterium]|nr:hypothetical protein [Bacteroidota bacterium]